MKLSSTFDHEFTDLLAKYIQALSDANDKLADICHHLCQESRGIEPYGERESREARIAYDQAIQHYQRLGQRLSRLYERL